MRANAVDGRLTAKAGAQVAATMNASYPGYPPAAPIDNLLELNADAVARELARAR